MIPIENLERFNPWWRTGKVRKEWLKGYRRQAYFMVERDLARRQITLIWGLRRTGKTTILFQVIEHLLEEIDPKQILYFSFDEVATGLQDVLEGFQKYILNKSFEESQGTLYVVLDEIQKVRDWENTIKTYYDLYPRIKFFLSGSASVALRKRSRESLAGRILDVVVRPLSFPEFLEMNGKDMSEIRKNPDLWKREIFPLFVRYLKWGTFPEIATEEDEDFARRYLLDTIVDRIVHRDLPGEYEIRDLELLKAIVQLIGNKPGMTVIYQELSKSLGRDQRTIANYFEYLEYGLLVRFVFNYRGSPLASMRKSKKAYLSSPNLAFALNPDFERQLPFLLENIVCSETDAKFFYKNSFEIDFVLPENEGLVGLEVKKTGKDVKQVKRFIDKFGKRVKKAMILDIEEEGKIEGIEILPIWKFLLRS
jgi:predicted AAA+ superfamily ATPase